MPQSFKSIVRIANTIKSSKSGPIIQKWCSGLVHFSGYRSMGLKFEDLIAEENDVVQTALARLPKEELYKRNYRILTAHQLAVTHQLLPDNKAVQPEEDTNYLLPYLLEAEAELAEKYELDNIAVTK